MITNVTEEVGKYFGYPQCCIEAYLKILANGGRKTAEQANPKVHRDTGFIPCPDHARQVLRGEVTLESLVNNRIYPYPFPNEPEMKVLDDYLKHIDNL